MGKVRNNAILLISHELSNTGAPILCRHISEQLKNHGYDTVIISLCRGKVTKEVKTAANEVKVVNIRHSYIKKALRMINPKWGKEKSIRLNYLIRHYRRKGYGRAIVNSMESGSIVPYMHKKGYKILTLVHEMSSVYERFNAYDKIDNIVSYSDDVVFPSKAVKEDFLGAASSEVKACLHMIPQGCYKKQTPVVEHDEARKKLAKTMGLSENARFLVGSGAFAIIKGVDFIPLIMNELRQYNDLHLLWLGEEKKDSYTIAVKEQIKRMKLEKNIHFLGFIKDSEKYNNILCGSEAFLLTSREDPMPSVMAEAMAMKLPVIGFKGSGGAEELLAEDRGLLAEYCDINDYCNKIKSVLDKTDDIEKIIENAYRYLKEKLVFEDYVVKLENILK